VLGVREHLGGIEGDNVVGDDLVRLICKVGFLRVARRRVCPRWSVKGTCAGRELRDRYAHLDAEVVVEPRNLGDDELLGKEALGEDVGFDFLALRGLAGEYGAEVPTVG